MKHSTPASKKGTAQAGQSFEMIRSRLAGMDAILDGDASLTPQRTQEILLARARALARTTGKEALEKPIALLVCRLGEQRYAMPLAKVVEIQPLGQFAIVPGAPPFIKGVINVRGQIFTVVDLATYFSIRKDENQDQSQSILIVGEAGNHVGLLVDEVMGISYYHASEIHNLKLNLPTVRGEYISGSTADAVAVLNLDELLSDRRMLVEDE